MSYQVLARKWRPQNFRHMVGQEHVLKALANALDQDRLHHAYLFSGTRGVGKTTVARIFAKSLNCETGVTSQPCGQCSACLELAEGRFVDLIEIDAASRTKVDDMRELLDNAQYAPTRSRYKIYLIDEVHMLSNSSFNALLKTLEEPPPHIKFLLATTDPQKLPVTVLSRCLQFNLKNLSPERIANHLKIVLQAEAVDAEEAALWEIAKAADGSMRDALSLTDQCIAFGNGAIATREVVEMLGTIDRQVVVELLQALAAHNGSQVLAQVKQVAEFSPDFASILQAMADLLHSIAIEQVVPDALDDNSGERHQISALAQQMTAEETQLFYEIALLTRRDLMLAPDPRTGFEMGLLRMLAFRPNAKSSKQLGGKPTGNGESDEEGEPQSSHQHAKAPLSGHSGETVSAETAGSNGGPLSDNSQPVPSIASVSPASERVSAALPAGSFPDSRQTHEQGLAGLPSKHREYQPATAQEFAQQPAFARGQTQATASELTQIIAGREAFESQQVGVAGENVITDDELVKPASSADANASGSSIVSLEQAVDSAEDEAEDSEELSEVNHSELEYTPGSDPAEGSGLSEPTLLNQRWAEVVGKLNLRGLTGNLAQRCTLCAVLGERLEFIIDEDHFDFFNQLQQNRLTDALSEYLGKTVRIAVNPGTSHWLSPLRELEAHQAELQCVAEQEIKSDPNVRDIIEHFDASMVDNSIEPVIKND